MMPDPRLLPPSLRRDLGRFSAFVIDASCCLTPAHRRRVGDYFTIQVSRIGGFSASWRLAFARAVKAAMWARSLGFFPVVLLHAGADQPKGRERLARRYVWICHLDELDLVISSRHVVPCAGVDLAARIGKFFTREDAT